MRLKEQSPLKGGVLANDCGTGKTVTFYLLQIIYYSRLLAKAKRRDQWLLDNKDAEPPADLVVDARPMLLLCPAPLVSQHAAELIDKLRGLLHIHIFYRSKAKAANTRMEHTLSPDDWDKEMAKRATGCGDPEICVAG